MRLAELPVFQSYDCHNCSRCCRGWFEVPVTADERERILAQGWGERLGLTDGEMFVVKGPAYRLAHHESGDCVFLGDDGKCRIHAEFGGRAKPLACQIYPYHFVPTGDGVRCEVRFDCPSVAGNKGRPLNEQAAELADLAQRQAGDLRGGAAPPEVTPGVPGDWPLLGRLVDLAIELLRAPETELSCRMIALARLAYRLGAVPFGSLSSRELANVLHTLSVRSRDEAAGIVAGEPPVPPRGMTRTFFRQLLAGYGRADRVGRRGSATGRLNTALRMLAGSGPIPMLRDDLPPAMFAATEDVTGLTAGELPELFTRYYHLRLQSHGFYGPACYGWSLVDGLAALVLTLSLTGWFARMLAAAAERASIEPADVERALGIVDGAHGRSALLAMPSEAKKIAYLTRPEPLLVLTRWYAR